MAKMIFKAPPQLGQKETVRVRSRMKAQHLWIRRRMTLLANGWWIFHQGGIQNRRIIKS